jgi:hypothetical protein
MQRKLISKSGAIVALLAAAFCSGQWLTAQNVKKGFPLATDGTDSPQRSANKLVNLGAYWYYNYGYTSPVNDSGLTDSQFVPMILSASDFGKDPIPNDLPDHILGYNEPDHTPGTSGCSTFVNGTSPEQGAQLWPEVNNRVKNNSSVGPASSYNGQVACYPWTPNSWYKDFHDDLTAMGIPHPTDIALHIYTCNVDTFTAYLAAAHANYPNNNFWVTEFACETESEADTTNGYHPSQDDVYSFINHAVIYMEGQSWITRYAWHDSKMGTSKIFQDGSSDLTCTGLKYVNPYATPAPPCPQ